MDTTELIGYAASALIMVSFLFGNIRKLRIVNTVGCILFVIYGVYMGMVWPIIITNVFITIVNLYYLMFANKA